MRQAVKLYWTWMGSHRSSPWAAASPARGPDVSCAHITRDYDIYLMYYSYHYHELDLYHYNERQRTVKN